MVRECARKEQKLSPLCGTESARGVNVSDIRDGQETISYCDCVKGGVWTKLALTVFVGCVCSFSSSLCLLPVL